ncbi:MAG: hypothetical protein PWR10_267 [Halanaerobiales bacterium]|nr:hypothetical protein [Halanaerobiales bacterium]
MRGNQLLYSVNRQPWRFRFSDGGVTISVDNPDKDLYSKRLDCGIAMLHFELGARKKGVARYRVTGDGR